MGGSPQKQALLADGRLLHAERLRRQLAVEVAVAPHKLRHLLAAEVELDLVVLREADAAVDLLAVRHHPPRGREADRDGSERWPLRAGGCHQ